MSDWNHNICADCWTKKNPDRGPVRLTSHPRHQCCYCHCWNKDGIFVRADPAAFEKCEHREALTTQGVVDDLVRNGLLIQINSFYGGYLYVTKPDPEPGSPAAVEKEQ